MYTNPHALKPGEKLSPQELFVRYLDWSIYARSVQAWKRQPTCDDDLHSSWLCCEDHVRYQLEGEFFYHYFGHHYMMLTGIRGFSLNSMAKMILQFQLIINPELKIKLIIYWGDDADTFFAKLGI